MFAPVTRELTGWPVQRVREDQSLLDAGERSQLSHRSAGRNQLQTLKRCDRPCSDTSHGTPTSEARTPLRHQSQVAWKANTMSAIHSKPLQHIQLFRPFNALCNHQASYFMCEADDLWPVHAVSHLYRLSE
jgi:hypothetical protein